jgi:competence protein ComGD
MSNRGYSMPEVMLSLLIISAVSMAALLPVSEITRQMQAEYLLNELQRDLHSMQLEAMKTGKEVSFRFYSSGQYRAVSEGDILLDRRPIYPLAFEELSLKLNQVQFNPNGNVRHFGQLRVTAASKKYNLVFQIGRGRFYFLEIE